jgi:hypothetical protein
VDLSYCLILYDSAFSPSVRFKYMYVYLC